MPGRLNLGLVAYVAGPFIFAAVLALEGAAHPAEARAIELREAGSAREHRAQLVRRYDVDGNRQPAESATRVRALYTASRLAPLWSTVLALGLAAAVAGRARLRGRVAIQAR